MSTLFMVYFRIEFHLPNFIGLLTVDIKIKHNDNFPTDIILLFHKPIS
jgi:hypothetical protein